MHVQHDEGCDKQDVVILWLSFKLYLPRTVPAPQLAMHASLSSSKVVPEPQSVFANALAMLASVKKTKHFFIVFFTSFFL